MDTSQIMRTRLLMLQMERLLMILFFAHKMKRID